METTWTKRHISLNIKGFLSSNKFPQGYDIFQRDDGTTMSPAEARAHLQTELASGHRVIPCSPDCGNPCAHADEGCAGFNYDNGCPGYRVCGPANEGAVPDEVDCDSDKNGDEDPYGFEPECYMDAAGYCSASGSEHCDWDCHLNRRGCHTDAP